jgi:molecular chaperone GrpE
MKENEVQIEKDSADAEPTNEPLMTVEPATATPEQLEELKQRAAKADDHWDRLLRTTADFDNYKKRVLREKQEAIKFANESLLQKLVPVLDTFDMALAAMENGQADKGQSLQAGINMVYQQLKGALVEAGLEEVDASGKPFDPNLHEAISQKETSEVPDGQVVQQIRKGYRLRERLLRPASVIVAKHPAA